MPEFVVGRLTTRHETTVVTAGSAGEAMELAREQAAWGGQDETKVEYHAFQAETAQIIQFPTKKEEAA